MRKRSFVRGIRGKSAVTHQHTACVSCDASMWAPIGETRCSSCKLESLGAARVGRMSNGRRPSLALHGAVLVQECTGSACEGWNTYTGHSMFWPSASLDAQGRCPFCRLPGTFDTRNRCKVDTNGERSVVHFLRHAEVLSVPCDETGRFEVSECDQTYGTDKPRRVTPSERPAWGTGWTVRDVTGSRQDYLSNWDSSD